MSTAYTGASLILEKLFIRPSLYDIACFSILASGPHLDATITSENTFRSSSIDAIIVNCGPLIMDASLVSKDFFGRSRISPIIKGLNSRPLCSSFGWSTKRNLSEDPALSIGPFQEAQCEVSYFPNEVRKSEKPPLYLEMFLLFVKSIKNQDKCFKNESEIEKIINIFSEKKAAGSHSILRNILKEYKKILSIPLALIINISFKRGIFPELCKIAHVIPVYKKGDQLDCSNYRPKSLLSNISKVFEKAMYSRLYDFLNKYNCLYKKQFGFQNSHSTNHALITEITEITEIIREALDRDEYSCGLLLDFQKAFDTVNHKILIGKLNHYGVRGLSLDWFKSYLTNRHQKTLIKDIFSDSLTVSYGEPQRSILGPHLFLTDIDDLSNDIAHSIVHHFADDTNITFSHKSLKKVNEFLNHDLSLLVQWLGANRISLNTNKTEIILFRTKNKILPRILTSELVGKK